MKEKQCQNVCYENVTGKEQKSEGEEVDLKKLILYSYLLEITENNNGTKMCTFCEYLLLTFAYSVNIDDTITNSVTEVINIKFYECMRVYYERRTHKYIKNLLSKGQSERVS